MKRLLSTLTALCMCASMSVGMLPASALSAISTDDTAVVRADSGLMARVSEDAAHDSGYEWSISDVTFDPANPPKGNIVQMPINVWNDPGTSGCTVMLTVDGKEFSGKTAEGFPFEVVLMKKGSAYTQFTQFINNPDTAEFADATANSKGESDVAKQGGSAAIVAFKLKDGAKLTPGTKYEIGFADGCGFSNATGAALNPTLSSGYIIIAGGEDTTTAPTESDTKTPTESDTKAPTESDTKAPTQPDTTENKHDNGYEWSVTDATFDPANPPKGNIVQMPINVWNDPGTSGCTVMLTVDDKKFAGKTAENFPFEVALLKKGNAYTQFTQFINNPDTAEFADATANSKGESDVAKQGGSAAIVAFKLKDGAELTPGTKYKIGFADECGFSNAASEKLNPILTPGYLIIAGEEDPPEPPKPENYKWYVEDAEFDPKADEQVLANIKVSGDPGTFAYDLFITIDGKSPADADFPFELKAVMDGKDAYSHTIAFEGNPANSEAAGVTENPVSEKNGFAKDDGTAVVYVLGAKEGVTYTPGKKYEVEIVNSKFSTFDKQVLFPTLESGFITIKGEEETTTAPTTEPTTDATTDSKPTEPKPTEPEPTDPKPTDPAFEHKEKEVDAKWIIGHDTVEPGAEVTIPVFVEGNTDGFNSYIADIKSADGPKLKDSSNGKISDNLNFVKNPDKLIFSATSFTKDGEMVKGDGDVFYMTFTAPTKPGKYALDFENLEIYDIDMVQLIPKTENGWIEVKAEETDFEHKKQDTAAKWVIGKVEIDAGTTKARVPVSVQGASKEADGINSYIAKIKQDKGPKATGAEAGSAYKELGLQQNLSDLDLIFAGTNSDQKKNITAADGDVFYIDFEIPADAAPGTVYNLKFADLELENMDMVQLVPTTEDGWIKIKEAETTTTEPIKVGDAGMWVIGTATVAPGEKVTIPVTVTGDKNGINSFIMKMGNPGKGGVTPTPEKAEKGNAYGEKISFVPNIKGMTFGSTNFELGENLKLTKDGAVVFNVTFTAPTEPGKYDLTFEDLSVYDINMSLLTPEKQNGWIEVVAESTTTSDEPVATTTTTAKETKPAQTTTTAKETKPAQTTTTPKATKPVQTTTTSESPKPAQTTTTPKATKPVQTTTTSEATKPIETTTTSKDPVVIGDAGMWIIGTDTVAPGATVTIPVTVTGDKNGINSFIMKMGNPGKGGVTPTPEKAEKGNAYGEKISFVPNIKNLTFGSTNFELGENLKLTKDGAVVFNVTFTAPTEPGKYDLTFEDLSVYDINMSLLTPEKQNGWIEVVAESTTTSDEPVATTTTSEATKPAQTTTTSEATKPAQTTTTSDATKPAQTTTTSDATKPVQTTTTSDAMKPVQTTTTSDVTKPVQTTTTSDATKPVQTTTTSDATKPVQTTTTSDATKPVQTTTTSDATKPIETTTTSEEPQPSETTTTSDIVLDKHEYEVTWAIGKEIGYAGEPIEVPIIVKGNIDEAMIYNSYKFELEIADGPVLKPESIRSGSAYSEMAIEANGLQVAGTNPTGDSAGYNGATILYLTFDLPKELAVGKYDVKFAGDVEAHNRAYDKFNITEENGYIQVLPPEVSIDLYKYQFDVEGLSKFYFSHDHRKFIEDGLLESELISLGSLMARPVLSDPTIETEWAPADLDKIEFKIKDETLVSPKAVFDTKVAPTLDDTEGKAFFKEQLAFTISTTFTTYDSETGEIVEKEQKDVDTLYDDSPMVTGDIYIGVKGDTNLDGTTNAKDAALQLIYAAENGAGKNPNILTVTSDMIAAIQAEGEASAKELENFVYFLSDVTDESEDHGDTSSILDNVASIDAKDAAKVLIYAAEAGAGKNPDWYRVLDEPLPKYTKLIGAADGNNDRS